MHRFFRYAGIIVLISLFPAAVSAASYKSGELLHITDPITGDAILSGTNVSVSAPISGEIFAAGQDVSLNSIPGRSAFLLGKTINSLAGSSYDLFAAGQTVNLSGTYQNDVYLAGSKVVVQPNTIITGNLYIVSAVAELAGKVDGNVYIKSSSLKLNRVVIGGALNYTANEEAGGLRDSHINSVHRQDPPPPANNPLAWLIPFFTTVLTAGLLIVAAPMATRVVTETLRYRYWRCLGIGYASIIFSPLLIVALFVSMIGYQLALLLLCLYVALLTLGGILGAVATGRLLSLRFLPAYAEHPWLVSLLGSTLVLTLSNLPGVSLAIGLFLFPAAIGAAIISMRRRT